MYVYVYTTHIYIYNKLYIYIYITIGLGSASPVRASMVNPPDTSYRLLPIIGALLLQSCLTNTFIGMNLLKALPIKLRPVKATVPIQIVAAQGCH